MTTPSLPLPASLQEVFAHQTVFNERGEKVPLASNISDEESSLLHAAVREIRPDVSLEVGCAHGVSTLAILEALHLNGKGRHHVMDPFQSRYENCGRAMVRRAGFEPHFSFYEKFAEDVIPGLPAVQFAFIDSSHLFDLTISEFVLTDRKLEVGGVIGFHDMWMTSQQSFIRYVLANRAYEVWQPASWPVSTGGGDGALKKLFRQTLSMLPGAERRFSKEFLKPWQEFRLANLVLLRKTAEDTRDWRFHARF